jgi:hypothetical protein
MRLVVSALAVLALALPMVAQSNVPTKEDPRGFSKDVVDQISQQPKSELGEQKVYTPPAAVAPAQPLDLPNDLAKIVGAQFGPDCKIALQKSSLVVNYRIKVVEKWTPFLVADLDNDGVEDAIIVARCSNALGRRDEFNYNLIDPYMAYHGYGDPKITAEISSADPMQGHAVLIIHGVGPEAWRAAKPKSKFVVLNLPFSDVGLTRVVARKGKPAVQALLLQQGETISSVLFWDGKKYKWRDSIGNQ